MIIGIGMDLCDVRRMARELSQPDGGFRDAVFTPGEIAYCESRRSPAQHYAARFAAKEAVLKALGAPRDRVDTGSFREVEVTVDGDGPRHVALSGRLAALAEERRVEGIHLSLTHDCGQAIANVVLEAARRPAPEVCHADG
jgi:holo-[acyl-carrier protein] synthase